jgi:hypothetical protein
MSRKVPERFAAMMVKDESGGEAQLGTLWQSRTAVLAFVRHFG